MMTETIENKGPHYNLIKSRIDPVFTDMSLARSATLKNTRLRREDWMIKATRSDHRRLAAANTQAWSAQNDIDRQLGNLKDVHSFAEPLLKARLLEQYNVDVDVKNTYLRLYASKQLPWYTIDLQTGSTARTVSLLDAALHNFSYNETYQSDSTFINKLDDPRDLYEVSPIEKKITVSQFQALCRELDIGAQYKAHLEHYLLNDEPVADAWLKIQVQKSQQAALNAAAHLAFVKKDISLDALALIIELIAGQRELRLNNQAMQVCELGIMDLKLTGILLITPDASRAQRSTAMIAYVPHDPEHPLKQYDSSVEFMQELTRQLRDNKQESPTKPSYRQFFSQFIDHEQRGHFFAGLEQRLSTVKWYAKEPGDPLPSWRETAIENPRLQFSAPPITVPVWTHVYQLQLSKILNDARVIAVSTADADSNARWAWWENFKKIASDIFNAALLVLTPFVPGLGELMLVYTAYQLTHDVIEGVVDLAEGLWTEAAEHIVGITCDVVQLVAFGAGAQLAGEFTLKASSFIDGMKPVQLPNGEPRLWHPDIQPYAHENLALPKSSSPDALGLHRHAGLDVLKLDDRQFVVKKEPASGQHRLEHPTRPDAYAPKLNHNGRGAWTVEGEEPRSWDRRTLMKRLGHDTDGFSDEQLENIRLISGTDEDALRRMHVENSEPPLLLDDSLKRFRAFDDAGIAGQQIRAGRPMDPASYWFEQMVTDLPGWPPECALKVYQNGDFNGMARTYGNANANANQTLSVTLGQVMDGKLPEKVVDFLDEAQLERLVGSRLPKEQSIQALRDRLADAVDGRRAAISDYTYRLREARTDPRVQQLQRQYPELPSAIAERLVANASKAELDTLDEQQRLSSSLRDQARECAFETRANRASEGFYQPELLTPDTERLVLNALGLRSDLYNDLRMEILDGTFDGPLRCSAGPVNTRNVRLLIRDEFGRYEVRDNAHHKLFEADNLYESILRALPERARQDLGFQPGQGNDFKQWLMTNAQTPVQRRVLLLEPSIRPVPQRETVTLLRGPLLSRQARTIEQRVADLYPHLNEHEINTFVRSLPAGADHMALMKGLEQELNELRNTLEMWKERMALTLPDEPAIAPDAVRHIANRLVECFERKPKVFGARSTQLEGGYALDLSTELFGHKLEAWWKKLPDIGKYLEQITTLNLDNMSFSSGPRSLLRNFTQLRQFSARRCNLTRLPDGVGQMQLLETLRLNDNAITLTPEAVEQLRNLTRLQTIRLDHNPLRLAPNIERMPRLKILSLNRTGIDTWPQGLTAKHRPRGFFLDLQGNPIKTIPEVVPGSHDALILARTRLDVGNLDDVDRVAYFNLRQSVGLPEGNAYSRLAADARSKWPVNQDSALWGSRAPGLGAYRDEAWDFLMREPNSAGFFRIINSLTESADYRAGGITRELLSRRVWDLIDAADLDATLRENLFQTAEEPTTCADAGSEVFNNMGIQALASQAYSYSTSALELEAKLVALAKGAARLDRVNEIARADSLSRPSRAEEVEIYLAYQTALAQRLDLPWQSKGLLHGDIAAVSDSTIDQAFETVMAREAGDGLVNAMLEQPFWEKYLRERYPNQFEVNDEIHNQQMDQLEDQRSGDAGLPLTEEEYSNAVSDLAYKRLDLARRLTRDLLQKHGL